MVHLQIILYLHTYARSRQSVGFHKPVIKKKISKGQAGWDGVGAEDRPEEMGSESAITSAPQ